MMMLKWQESSDCIQGLALIFGSGLIGNAVCKSITQAKNAQGRQFSWNWFSLGAIDAPAVEQAVLDAIKPNANADISIIWAAGQSGFGSDTKVMEQEFLALKAVVDLAHRLAFARPNTSRSFHLVSSAGGLFEGQVACGLSTAHRPLRPYGFGKIAQEQLIAPDATLGHRRIYRPSSVYGYEKKGRWGLISVLILHAIQAKPAYIMGAMTTLRDYIFAPDIGKFIASRVCQPGTVLSETLLLASGRPTSIFEVVSLIETLLGMHLFLQIDPTPENARDNTFLRSSLPQDFIPTGLIEGINQTAQRVKINGYTRVKR
jgi:UDP-glucose 4-epimerase